MTQSGAFVLTVFVSLLLCLHGPAHPAEAQSARRVYRVGVLEASTQVASSARVDALRAELRHLGYQEGSNLRIDSRFADGHGAALSGLAIELVGLSPDILVSFTGVGAHALRKATPRIPIVLAGADPDAWLITPENLARPGAHITGVISAERELEGKRMELLREAMPSISLVATFRDATVLVPTRGVAPARPQRWGLTFLPIDVTGPGDFAGAFAQAVSAGAGALSVLNTAMFDTHRRHLAELAVRHRLAWIASERQYAEAGCLLSYGAERTALVRRAASYVDRILRGATPAELPMERPTSFELVLNLKTARALGLTLPAAVLARVDEIIE